MAHTAAGVADAVAAPALEALNDAKPRLRGWFHAVAAPVALVAGVPLVALSPGGAARSGSVVFVGCTLVNFSVSAAMHRGRWSPAAMWVLTRLDHASIFLVIAGSYTPIALLLLPSEQQQMLLAMVWTGAAVGACLRVAWVGAPRWGHVSVYLGPALVVLFFVGDIAAQARADVLVMLGTAGVLYAAGGVVYTVRRPNPDARWFGFHEVFHALTVLAFASLYSALAITVSAAPA